LVYERRWDSGGTVRAGNYIFSMKRKQKSSVGNRIFLYAAVKSVGLVSDRRSYIVLRDRWCNIVWNVHVPSEVKSDYSKDSFYEKLQQVFEHFPKVP